MTTIKTTLSNTWDNLLGRAAILALAVGWVPFTLLSMAHTALKH